MSLTVLIAGNTVDVQSIQRPDKIDQHTTLTITVIDSSGTAFYQRGQPITVTDSILGTIFTGYVAQPQMRVLYPSPQKLWTLVCTQRGDYLAAKRTSNKIYSNQFAGTIFIDQIQRYLSAEGITAKAALRWDELQTDWAAGTLSNTIATTNATDGNPGDGDLELALAGSAVTITENTTTNFSTGTLVSVTAANNALTPTATNAVKIVGTQSVPGAGNSYTYVKIWAGSQVVGASNFLDYDIWVDPSSPEIKIGVDLIFSDGTSWRDTAIYFDAQNQPPHPATNLKGLADGQWYHRDFFLNNYNGKTISYVAVAIEGDSAGTYTGWIKNIAYTDNSRNPITNFFAGTLQTAQQLQTNGYANVAVSVVPTYVLSLDTGTTTQFFQYRISPSYSVDAVKLLRSSFISWQATTPANTQVTVKYSLDNWNGIYLQCTNNAALPGLPAGTNLAGRSLLIAEEFTYVSGASPEVTPSISSVQITLNPTYNATKSDVIFQCGDTTAWNQAGTTLTNTTAPGKVLTLLGSVRNFDDGSDANQTLFGGGSPAQVCNNKAFSLSCNASNNAASRLDFAGTYQNFIAEFDVYAQASMFSGLTYRTTGWQNNANTVAYILDMSTTAFNLGRGTNSSSGSGTYTSIASVAISLTSGNWHHVKIVVNGSNHKAYLDDVLLINATDGTYSAAGNVGFTFSNQSGSRQTAQYDNFGIVATNADTGTWLSPNISLTSAANYGNSVISWRDQSTNPSNSTLLVEASINGGSTWQTCTNGTAIPNFSAGQSLSGVNLTLRITPTSTTATTLPGIDNLLILILGQFNASGTRVSPSLSLAAVGRAGTALINWNALLPAATSLLVQTSIDLGASYQTVSAPGGAISGISTQPNPVEDTFASNSSSNYTQSAFSGITTLTLYGSAVASSTLSTANAMATTTGGTETTKTTTGPASGNGIVEILSQGGSGTLNASLPSPSGHGWLYDSTALEGQTIPAGNWSASIALSDAAGSGPVNAYTLRASKRSSGGTYTTIGTLTISSTTISSTRTVYTFSLTSFSAVSFATGDKLYFDEFIDAHGWGSDPILAYLSNSSSVGVANDLVVTTPGYLPSSSWTWDTANSRLVGSGGTNATLINSTALTAADNQIIADFDQADGSGILTNYTATSSGYYIQIWDASASGTPNTVKLFRRSGGVSSQVGSTATISFTRGTPHRFILDVQAGVMMVSMDGSTIITYTDGSPLGAGSSGFLLNALLRAYSLRIQQYGQNVSALSLLTKLTLSSTDPTVTPQMLDMQAFVSSTDIGAGVLIPSVAYQRTFINANLDDLTKQSDYLRYFRNDLSAVFQARVATPAPFVLSSLNSQVIAGQTINDVLIDGAELDNSGDSYRNRQIMKGAILTATYAESKVGDGSTRTWNVAHPLTAPPTSISLNSQKQNFGVKGIDTGKNFYYQVGSTAIDQDSSGTLLQKTDSLAIAYTGSSSQDVVLDNTGGFPGTITQAQMAALENAAGGSSSGIVEAVEDASNMTVAAATTVGNQRLQRYGNIGRSFLCKTLLSGFAPGQQVPLFVPEYNLSNVQMLITQIDVVVTQAPGVSGGLLYTWKITAMEGPNLGDWVKLFINAFS